MSLPYLSSSLKTLSKKKKKEEGELGTDTETHREKALGRWRVGLQDLQASECPRELGNQQK